MPNNTEVFAHLLVPDAAENEDFHRPGGGNQKIRNVEQRAHGRARLSEVQKSLAQQDLKRSQAPLTEDELRSLGVIVVLEGAGAEFPLQLDSLNRMSGHRKTPRRPEWLLLSVSPPTAERSEQAMVWVSDEYRPQFVKIFEQFATETTPKGNPKHGALVANIAGVRSAVLDDLWQSKNRPPTTGSHWWEVWLRPGAEAKEQFEDYARRRGLRLAKRTLALNDRTVGWMHASWVDLAALPFTQVPVAELRWPEFIDTIEDLSDNEQAEYISDLADRITPASDLNAPAVCHLDTGIRRTHALLRGSLSVEDVHSIVDEFGADQKGHGTAMAGLSLYGPIDDLLVGSGSLQLAHRLESVKFLPDAGLGTEELAYGLATAQAVALPEVTARRRRVFSMPVTTPPDRPGEPTLWSASVDALAAGVDISRSESGIELLGVPDRDAARLFVVSAGNVWPFEPSTDYRDACDLSPAEDPAQAWNVLTVGAYTELDGLPSHPDFDGWSAVGVSGDLSPHSRTSVTFGDRPWPIKPDICMEGGNVLSDGTDFAMKHPVVSLRTTGHRDDQAVSSANATSAATAQTSRLAAIAMARYPTYWPETIRGLLVHAAEWTPPMREQIDLGRTRAAKLRLLRRYGWGVPNEETVLNSTRQAVTTVTQDEFTPFDDEHRARYFRLHRLPWPVEALRSISFAQVSLRITLSYFIEPTASRRGWRQRYSYASHGLRFDLKLPTETTNEFIARVNHDAQVEEDDSGHQTGSASDRWLIGTNQRNLGSLHQDVWEGSAADLADSGVIAVYPVGGWWKNGKRADRVAIPVRYSLLVSLKTEEEAVDLYTPIALQLRVPVEIPGS